MPCPIIDNCTCRENYFREIKKYQWDFKAKGNQQLLTNSGEQQGQDKNNTDTTPKTELIQAEML